MKRLQTVEEYINTAAPAAQSAARKVRALIKAAAPGAEEKLSYGMPYYSYKGRLIYWGTFKNHLGLYVMSDAREALAAEIEPYRTAKATLHFPLDKPLPEALITKIVTTQRIANETRHTPAKSP